MRHRILLLAVLSLGRTQAFVSPSSRRVGSVLGASNNEASSCWNPQLRTSMASIATLGALETSYLTYQKLSGGAVYCATEASSCQSVLEGPYSVVPGTELPLAACGVLAYGLVAFLALQPTLSSNEDDTDNRLALTALVTGMGVFSVFLLTLLFGVIHETCVYCVASAVLSIALAKLAWLSGAVPQERVKQGIQWSFSTGLLSLVASFVLFSSGDVAVASNSVGDGTTLLADSNKKQQVVNAPPPILTTSSPRAMQLSRDLASLDARMFGAYWCSHCYDQKQSFGKEAFANIDYVECSRDGLNAQTSLCKSRNVPGYPTWEIGGQLYPGEKALDELEEIVVDARK